MKIRADLGNVEAQIRKPTTPPRGESWSNPCYRGNSPRRLDEWGNVHPYSYLGSGGRSDEEDLEEILGHDRRGNFVFEN